MTPTRPNSGNLGPLAYERAGTEAVQGVFRDGKHLVVPRKADISRYCICCGRPSQGKPIHKRLYQTAGTGSMGGSTGTDGGAIVAILFCILLVIYFIAFVAELLAARDRTVTFGLCEAHKSRRGSMMLTAWLMFPAGMLIFILSIVSCAAAPSTHGALVLPIIGCVVGPLLWFTALIVASRAPGVRLVREKEPYLWLKGVGPGFLDAQAQIPETMTAVAPKKPKR